MTLSGYSPGPGRRLVGPPAEPTAEREPYRCVICGEDLTPTPEQLEALRRFGNPLRRPPCLLTENGLHRVDAEQIRRRGEDARQFLEDVPTAAVLARRVAVLETVAEKAAEYLAVSDHYRNLRPLTPPLAAAARDFRAALSAAGAATDQGDGTC